MSDRHPLFDDPAFVADFNNTSLSGSQLAAKWGPDKATLNRWRKRDGVVAEPTTQAVASAPADTLSGRAVFDSDGGEFVDVQTTELLSDFDDIFRRFNRDPGEFVIVDDTVRVSNWQQSKRLENGERDVINLFSYSARFKRRISAGIDVNGMVESLRAWKPATTLVWPDGEPVTMFVGWADWQLGKGDGDGTEGTKQRILDGFEATEARIRSLQKQGVNITALLIGNMGDHTEMVTGHYTAQRATTDLNLREQLTLALELNLTGIKTLAPLVEETTYAACLCNHGQWQREAGKQITDDSDNATGFLGDTLRTVCDLHPTLSHLNWIIPRDEMITTGVFSGVPVAMSHGHKTTGPEETWLSKQSGWLQATQDFRPELWITAHRHTAAVNDFGPYHRVQCTTVDPGSKSFTDATGKFSTQGTTTFLIGRHNIRRFSHYEVL